MALAHWNWRLVAFGIALAEGRHADRLGAKAAVVALTG